MTTRDPYAVAMDAHRQEHDPATGGSVCACGGWEGPFTMHVTDGRGYADHLATAIREDEDFRARANPDREFINPGSTEWAVRSEDGTTYRVGKWEDGVYYPGSEADARRERDLLDEPGATVVEVPRA